MALTRTQVYLTPEQHQNIQRLAQALDTTMAEVIRQAIDDYMVMHAEANDPLLDIIGLGASGIPDGSVQHDRDIYAET